MASPRHERERAAWVLSRAGRWRAARRRGELLMAKARKHERSSAGVGDDVFVEVATRNVFMRHVFRSESPGWTVFWFLVTTTWMSWTLLLVGPALLLGLVVYAAWWAITPWAERASRDFEDPRKARLGYALAAPRSWPLAVLAVLAGTAMVLTWSWWSPQGTLNSVVTAWWNAQLPLGLARAAWRVRAYGWPAVQPGKGAARVSVKPIDVVVPDDQYAFDYDEVLATKGRASATLVDSFPDRPDADEEPVLDESAAVDQEPALEQGDDEHEAQDGRPDEPAAPSSPDCEFFDFDALGARPRDEDPYDDDETVAVTSQEGAR